MSTRIGLAVSSDSVRVVAVRDGHIVWAGHSPIDDGIALERAIATLLGAIVVPRWPRPRVIAAIGPAQAQVKRLTGLPPVSDARIVARLVTESPGRFFLRNGIPLAMTGVRLEGAGDAWSGALDEPVVRAIADGCATQRFSLRGVVPTVLVLGTSLEGSRIVWPDGDVVAELSFDNGALVGIRRLPMGSEQGAPLPTPRFALDTLGDDAWRFADAYAAAMTSDDEPVAARPGRPPVHERPRVPRWRLTAAIVAVMVAALLAMLAPGLLAIRAAARAERALRDLGPARTTVVRAESDLRRVSAALDEAEAFESARRSPTVFLSRLADALPPAAQVVAVRLDSAGGSVVALAPRAGDVVAAIEGFTDIAAPQVAGPMTRELVGQQEKERVTVRFRWRRAGQGASR